MHLWRHSIRKTVCALAIALSVMGGAHLSADAVGSDDFPYRGIVGRLDPWGFYTGYCTSFVAWRLAQAGIPFRGATLRGPSGQARLFGNAGDWDAAARAIGFLVDNRPTPGAVAVWHGGQDGAWPTGHVAYVTGVDAAGGALVEEYNWGARFRYGTRATRTATYIHFTGAVTPPPPPPPPSARGFGTTTDLRARTGPGTDFAIVRVLPSGATIQIACQVRSSSVVGGSGIWDRLTDGTYVTDYYTTTPAFNDFSPGVARC